MHKHFQIAHFVPCPKCGLHGRITYSDTTQSLDIKSFEDADREIDKALKANKILPIEVPLLKENIEDAMDTITAIEITVVQPKKESSTVRCNPGEASGANRN